MANLVQTGFHMFTARGFARGVATIATGTQQQRSVLEFLSWSANNHFAGRPTPSLLPSNP